MGGGESGVGSAVLAKQKGFNVFLSDQSLIKEKYKAQLIEENILFEEGKHIEENIFNADEVIKSPGIPDQSDLIQKLISKSIPVISEIEFAGRYTNAKKICITGSNGKTTTSLLTYHILKNAGYHVGLGGNIGKSFAMQVARENYDYYVLELSSFQLDGMFDFVADVAILLNIVVVYVVLKSSAKIEKMLGKNGLGVIRKTFGIVLLAIAVKLFASNVKGLFM